MSSCRLTISNSWWATTGKEKVCLPDDDGDVGKVAFQNRNSGVFGEELVVDDGVEGFICPSTAYQTY